jgi:hypothetical protein
VRDVLYEAIKMKPTTVSMIVSLNLHAVRDINTQK